MEGSTTPPCRVASRPTRQTKPRLKGAAVVISDAHLYDASTERWA